MEKNGLLRNAIKWLKGNGYIAEDQEIADAVGISKSRLSNYINDTSKASADFIINFEEKFLKKHDGITLEHFREIRRIKKPAPLTTKERDAFLVSSITQLRAALAEQSAQLKEIKEMLKSLTADRLTL